MGSIWSILAKELPQFYFVLQKSNILSYHPIFLHSLLSMHLKMHFMLNIKEAGHQGCFIAKEFPLCACKVCLVLVLYLFFREIWVNAPFLYGEKFSKETLFGLIYAE